MRKKSDVMRDYFLSICRKSAGFTIRIPRNDLRESRSLSPVTMKSALPAIAHSRM